LSWWEGKTKDAAEAMCDTLCELTENTLFSTPAFVRLFEQIDEVDTRTEYRGVETRVHTAVGRDGDQGLCHRDLRTHLDVDLTGINIYVDSVNIFDPQGDYTGQIPFDIPGPPREIGPDGRPKSADHMGGAENRRRRAIETEARASITT
jgi:hypothetical protein